MLSECAVKAGGGGELGSSAGVVSQMVLNDVS